MKPILAVSLLTLVAVGVIAVNSSAAPGCTIKGTPGRDILVGDRGRDVICGYGGNDYLHGNGGNDILRGGAGRDTIVGGAGRDVAHGDAGPDRIFLVDGHPGGQASGGKGKDTCFVDIGDHVKGCEVTYRGVSEHLARSLTSSFHGGLSLAVDLIDAAGGTATQTVTQTVTTTTTVTVTVAPECIPPPASPPPIC